MSPRGGGSRLAAQARMLLHGGALAADEIRECAAPDSVEPTVDQVIPLPPLLHDDDVIVVVETPAGLAVSVEPAEHRAA